MRLCAIRGGSRLRRTCMSEWTDPMAFDIKAWSNYGVAVVGAAAVLVGLLFVAVSVNSAWFASSEAHRGRAGQALVLFVVPLRTGILLLIPGQSTTALGLEIAA